MTGRREPTLLAHPPGQSLAAQPLLSRAKQHPSNQRTGVSSCTEARHSLAWSTEGCTSSFGADTSLLLYSLLLNGSASTTYPNASGFLKGSANTNFRLEQNKQVLQMPTGSCPLVTDSPGLLGCSGCVFCPSLLHLTPTQSSVFLPLHF